MKAILFKEFGGDLSIGKVPEPELPVDGVVMGVRATGICRSDWHGWMGHDSDVRVPHVPGHEMAGEVVAVGEEVRRWAVGDQVTVPFSCGCGRCEMCAAGQGQVCDDYFQPGFTAWGSFAERVAIPHADENLVRLPESMGYVEAASLGCRFATSYRALMVQGRVRAGDWVAVHGCGGVGLAAVMIAVAAGAQVVAVDIREEALSMAKELGAAHGVKAGMGRTEKGLSGEAGTVRELTRGGAHVSVDALGSKETSWNSVMCLRKQGRHVQVGLMVGQDKQSWLPMSEVIARELEIRGSHGMAANAYGPMLEMIQSGRLNPARLVRKRVALEEAPEELKALGEFRGVGVTVIDRF